MNTGHAEITSTAIPISMRVALWTCQLVCAAVFLTTGVSKLIGTHETVRVFDTMGAGQWLRYAIGLAELAGAVMIVSPPVVVFGALLLFCVMVGAVSSHLLILGGSPALAVAFAMITGFVAWARRYQLRS